MIFYRYIPLVASLSCDISLQYFPFDVQQCSVNFGSWEYGSKLLVLLKDNNPILTTDYKKSAEWNIIEATVGSLKIVYHSLSFRKKISWPAHFC